MYRLLIVTRNQRVEGLFNSMQGWEIMGFKPPRLRKTVVEAIECMHKHHIDAIAIDAEPDYAELEQWLDENAPDIELSVPFASSVVRYTELQAEKSVLNQEVKRVDN